MVLSQLGISYFADSPRKALSPLMSRWAGRIGKGGEVGGGEGGEAGGEEGGVGM